MHLNIIEALIQYVFSHDMTDEFEAEQECRELYGKSVAQGRISRGGTIYVLTEGK